MQNKLYRFLLKRKKQILYAQIAIFCTHLVLLWYSYYITFAVLWLIEGIAAIAVMYFTFYKDK